MFPNFAKGVSAQVTEAELRHRGICAGVERTVCFYVDSPIGANPASCALHATRDSGRELFLTHEPHLRRDAVARAGGSWASCSRR